MNAQKFEIMAAAVALLCGVSGAFLFAAQAGSSMLLFVAISASIILCAAAVLLLRLHWHNTAFNQLLFEQLPREQICQPGAAGLRSDSSPTELVTQLGSYVREQQEMLAQQFCIQLLDDQKRIKSLSESEITLRLLQAELQSLQDQYDTDIDRRGQY